MTGFERVLKTVNHEPVDRVPIDFGAHTSTGISVFAYRRLREYLGMPIGKIEMIDCIQCLARIDDDVLERFHVDTMLLNPPWPRQHTWNPRGDLVVDVPDTFQPKLHGDGSWRVEMDGEILIMPEGGYFFDGAWPDYYRMGEEEKIAYFAPRAEMIFKERQKFTIYMGFSAFFHGIEFACDMLTDPEECKVSNQALLEKQIRHFDLVNAKMGRYLGAVAVNGDLGMQTALMCSPQSYEECCYPYLRAFCEHVHKTSDLKVFMHACGSHWDLMEYIVDAGIDIINPVQISAAGMDPARLKERYGDKICFWGGGCDTQHVLGWKSSAEVYAHVEGLVKIFKRGGGFVFNQVHNVLGNVPPENVVAMFDAAYSSGRYV